MVDILVCWLLRIFSFVVGFVKWFFYVFGCIFFYIVGLLIWFGDYFKNRLCLVYILFLSGMYSFVGVFNGFWIGLIVIRLLINCCVFLRGVMFFL